MKRILNAMLNLLNCVKQSDNDSHSKNQTYLETENSKVLIKELRKIVTPLNNSQEQQQSTLFY
ncbi:MAG TPA: hypothetical protein VE130_02295 [Nitrososphaeraceae archaeon]|jgi:hypothetical protein|nr:hypothetical protein [Nitrososphaeraceae archaeon]